MVKVVIEDLPDEAPVLTATQFSATLCEDAVGGEIVELVRLCTVWECMYLLSVFQVVQSNCNS